MSDWEQEIVIQITEQGALNTEAALKKVSREYQRLKALTKDPLTPLGNGRGPDAGFAGAFSVNSMHQATGALSHFGIEYEKVRGAIRAPLSGGDNRFADAFTKTGSGLDKLIPKVDKTRGAFAEAATAVRIFRTLLIATGIERFAETIIGVTDSLTNLQNKIRVVSDSTGAFMIGMEGVAAIARETRASIDSVATVYSRTARSVEGLGKSQAETLQFTQTLAKAVQVGGSTAVEASNAMIQLSQGLASGTLKGDELRSVLEQLPVVAQLIAKHMGVTVGRLRELGMQGKLTSKQVFESIIAGTDEMDKKFAKLTPTVSQAWEVLKNKATEASAALQPLMKDIATGLIGLADNFNLMITSAKSAAYAFAVILAAQAIPKLITGIKTLSLALVSSGWGAVVVGVGALVAALIPLNNGLGDTADGVVRINDVWTAFRESTSETKSTLKDLFDSAGVGVYILSLDEVLIRMAKMIDFVRILNPERQIGAWLGVEDPHEFEKGMRATLSRAKGLAADRVAQKQIDTETKFNAWMKDRMPGAHPETLETPKPKVSKEGGLTFAELVARMQQEQEVSSMTPFEGGVTKEFFQKMGLLKDSIRESLVKGAGRGGKADEQLQQLQQMIRLEHELAEAQKFVRHWDEEIAEERERRAKAGIAAGKHEADNQRKAADQIAATNRAIQASLDPFSEYNSKINDYNTFLRDNPEQADAVVVAVEKMGTAYQTFSPIFQGISTSIADAAANALVFGDNLSSALKKIAMGAAAASISGVFQLGLGALFGSGIAGAMPGVNGGNPLAAPPKAKGGYVPGFEYGGYTGSYARGDIAGVVHGREFVVNANATARNRAMLESMNAGKPVSSGPKVVVNNYAGVNVDTATNDNGDLEIRIRSAIASQTPGVMARELSNATSKTSKSLRQHYDVTRKTG